MKGIPHPASGRETCLYDDETELSRTSGPD